VKPQGVRKKCFVKTMEEMEEGGELERSAFWVCFHWIALSIKF